MSTDKDTEPHKSGQVDNAQKNKSVPILRPST